MPGCAAIGCNNRSEKGFTMKCFPRDPALRKIWKQRVGRADWEPSNNSFLCHVHFKPNQWVVSPGGRVKLKKGAVPSIFTVTSTRKSPKKRLKVGEVPTEDEDFDDYEVEYLENDGPIVLNLGKQLTVPNIINVETQSTPAMSGQILQNIKFISSDTLKDLHNENIIIVADENNREIGKIINDNGLFLMENERGKENVLLPTRSEKSTSEVKIEVKEEMMENGLNSHYYDEIERKLEEICQSDNEEDISDTRKSFSRVDYQSIGSESSANPIDSKNSSSTKETSNERSNSRLETNRKRKSEAENVSLKTHTKSNQSVLEKKKPFAKDVSDIINDLETEIPTECDIELEQPKNLKLLTDEKPSQSSTLSKPIIKNDIQLKLENNIVTKTVPKKVDTVKSIRDTMSLEELTTKIDVQSEVIQKLTSQLIMYKDMEKKFQIINQELRNKDQEIYALTKKSATKKPQIEKRIIRNDSIDLKNASKTELRERIDYLEENNKRLMKTVTEESQNRKKLECQVKSRDNQIKEFKWKLDKASKFLDRAEKNANNYRKRMLEMQALIRRKQLSNEKNGILDEFLVGQSDQNFSDNALKIALEIENTCGIEGYQKLLNYEFPLPPLKELSKKYPAEVEYYEPEETGSILESRVYDTAVNDVLLTNIKTENIEYLDSEFFNDTNDTVTGTVQDIFNENSDSEELNLNELKKHIMTVW